MTVADRLAHALGRRDEAPNIALAEDIAGAEDGDAVAELVDILSDGAKAAKHDAIKVLYEVGDRKPGLIAPAGDDFIALAGSADNRLVWGALTALACLSRADPAFVFAHLTDILSAADSASVIAKDQAVNVLITLAGHKNYEADAVPMLLARLQASAINQLPMYAEQILAGLPKRHHGALREVLYRRITEAMKPSKLKRIEKVLRRLARHTA